jgi:hypothetical protein
MSNYNVIINFNDGTHNYDLPLVQSAQYPEEGMKATVINGTRSDGAIVIPGGKRSPEITVRGILAQSGNHYKDIITAIQTLRTNVTTDVATLKKTHVEGASTITDWSLTVRRINPIEFPDSLQVYQQEYIINFLVLAF